MGGRELFGSEFAVAVEDGDVGALAAWIEGSSTGYDATRADWERRGAEATEFIGTEYSREQATHDLVACFGAIETAPGVAATLVTSRDLPRRSVADRAETG